VIGVSRGRNSDKSICAAHGIANTLCRFRSLSLVVLFLASFTPAWGQAGNLSCSPRSCKYPAKRSDGSPFALSESADGILTSWRDRALYYVVMGVTNGPKGAREDDFAKADADSLIEALCKQGFKSLPDSAHMSRLVGPDATLQNLDAEITENLPKIDRSKRPLLLFYYSGHGQVDDNFGNLILWSSDAKTLEARYSFSLREEVRRIRTVYQGDLIVILDACYSGQAFRDLSNVTYDDRTAVLASSSDDQQSEALKLPSGSNQLRSAFTFALTQVLLGSDTCDPSSTDPGLICKSISDGVLGLNKLAIAVKVALGKLPLKHKVDPVAHVFAKNPVGMIGYFCETVKDLDSNERELESGNSELFHAVKSAYPLPPADNEALGITDAGGNLLAIVTAHVSNGALAAVTINSLIDKAVSAHVAGAPPAAPLMVVSLDVRSKSLDQWAPGLTDIPTIQNAASLSASGSKSVLQSFVAQVSKAKAEGTVASSLPLISITMGVEDSGTVGSVVTTQETVVLKDEESIPSLLFKDATGKVVFESAHPLDSDRIQVNATKVAVPPS